MDAVTIHIGPFVFDHTDYDPDGDILYLHVGPPQVGDGEETPSDTCPVSDLEPSGSSD